VNIKEYISSGLIESYVLGLASEQEQAEFEQLCAKYPDVLNARIEFEKKLEKQAFQQAIAPPAFLKDKIATAIQMQDISASEAKVVTMEGTPRASNMARYIAAASIILLLAATYFAYDFYTKYQKLKNLNDNLALQVNRLNSDTAKMKADMEDMMDPNSAVVVNMVGTQPSSTSSANVYWDSASSKVFLVVRNLPKLPTNKQYQLWAFINGQPVDLGLFDRDDKNVILQMRNTKNAEAFAITIEDRGNGPVPHGSMETKGVIDL
jgi:anti-sigma-K factor RskA